MTDVLILGGTGWLSGRIARRWLEAGTHVTCLARGERPAPEGAVLVRGDRDVPHAYDALMRDWDEVIDISSRADHARDAVAALGDRAAHWTYISSVSVYADADVHGADETAPLDAPAESTEDHYAAQKVAAEEAVLSLGDRVHIIRPGLIVGPGDPSDRFGYWAAAFARAGEEPVLVPDATGRFVQVMDVDDLAVFATNSELTGIRNAVGDPYPLNDVLELFRSAAGYGGESVVAADDWLEEHDVQHWRGERSLPLWLPLEWSGFMTRSNAAYLSAGGRRTPIEKIVGTVLADERARGLDRARGAGLSRAEETALLSDLAA